MQADEDGLPALRTELGVVAGECRQELAAVGRLGQQWGTGGGQQLTAEREFGGAVAVGQEAVIADALKAFGQNVQQEAANELVGGERHGLLPVAVAIVFPAKADLALVDVDKAIVRDSDAVSVSRDIGQDLFRIGEGRFGIDAPFCFAGRSEVALEDAAVAQRLQGPVEGQLFGGEGLLKRGQEQPAKETRKHAHGQKEIGPAGDPTVAVRRKTAAGDDAVQVWVMAPTRTIP